MESTTLELGIFNRRPAPCGCDTCVGASVNFLAISIGHAEVVWRLATGASLGTWLCSKHTFAADCRCDVIFDEAKAANQTVRGHNLCWHTENPSWLTNGNFTPPQLTAVLQDHIRNVVTHYGTAAYGVPLPPFACSLPLFLGWACETAACFPR
jgi:hypothetical protein